MKALNEFLNESKQNWMSNEELKDVYDSLKKGDEVNIQYQGTYSGNTEKVFQVTKDKTEVGKFKTERITLTLKENPKGVKYYLYQRNGNISLAIGDMGASLIKMEKI